MSGQNLTREAPQFRGTFLGVDETGRLGLLVDAVVVDGEAHEVAHRFEARFEGGFEVEDDVAA